MHIYTYWMCHAALFCLLNNSWNSLFNDNRFVGGPCQKTHTYLGQKTLDAAYWQSAKNWGYILSIAYWWLITFSDLNIKLLEGSKVNGAYHCVKLKSVFEALLTLHIYRGASENPSTFGGHTFWPWFQLLFSVTVFGSNISIMITYSVELLLVVWSRRCPILVDDVA